MKCDVCGNEISPNPYYDKKGNYIIEWECNNCTFKTKWNCHKRPIFDNPLDMEK